MDRKKPERRLAAPLVVLLLSAPPLSHSLQFPDTTQLKKDWKLSARAADKPAAFFRKDGDSASLVLEWRDGRIAAARYEQGKEFEQGDFDKLTESYGNGAAWHEFADGLAAARKLYPGLQQEWLLKGYGSEKGWLGSGVEKSRYFLVFRENPPAATPAVAGPLRLKRSWFHELDTSSEWLHVPCSGDSAAEKKTKGRKAGPTRPAGASGPVCFSPDDDSRFTVRVDAKAPLAVDIRLKEEESESLQEIRKAVQTVSDAAQHDYAQDMAQILYGEAQLFLVKLAQRAPGLFTWPSWQLQDLKGGKVPEPRYLEIIRSEREPGDFLPALQYEDANLRMSVDLYYDGSYRFQAREK